MIISCVITKILKFKTILRYNKVGVVIKGNKNEAWKTFIILRSQREGSPPGTHGHRGRHQGRQEAEDRSAEI